MNDWKLRLKQSREAKGLNKTTFAKLVGVSNATVTDWEKGVDDGGIKELSATSLVKIYEVLEVDLYWLLSGKGVSNRAAYGETVDASSSSSSVVRPKPIVVVAPAPIPEATWPDMLQWISTQEANLLTDFRTLEVGEQETLLDVARSLPRITQNRARTDQG